MEVPPYDGGIPLPPSVSPLIYPYFGIPKQGVNTATEIFPEKNREKGTTPKTEIKISGKI
jgi:hypothetical protein